VKDRAGGLVQCAPEGAANLLRLCSQPPPLVVAEPEASIANLFSKDAVFFHQVLDDMPLMLIHPAGQSCDEE
jgi:hypothetical protein